MQIKMPKELLETPISQMQVGGKGYTVPWAVLVECDTHLTSINTNYTYLTEPTEGTRCMLVERNREGYIITVPTDYKFTVGASHFGAKPTDYAPVVGIKTFQ
jgi:hypothetical protein